jgi:hypothetical protein
VTLRSRSPVSQRLTQPRLLYVGTNEEDTKRMDGRVVWAAEVLRTQRMPPAEIGAVLEAKDAEDIRRRLELQGERLQERLVDELRTLARVERLLTEALEPAAPGRALSRAGTS